MRLALPAAILAVGGIGLLPCLMTLGFCFCTLGDAMGVAGSFEGQMGGFALAQICFIAEFAKDIRRSAQAVPPRKPHPVAFMAATLLCEEYPLADAELSPAAADGSRILDTQVCALQGVGRFVLGLADHIRILDAPELRDYLTQFTQRYLVLK